MKQQQNVRWRLHINFAAVPTSASSHPFSWCGNVRRSSSGSECATIWLFRWWCVVVAMAMVRARANIETHFHFVCLWTNTNNLCLCLGVCVLISDFVHWRWSTTTGASRLLWITHAIDLLNWNDSPRQRYWPIGIWTNFPVDLFIAATAAAAAVVIIIDKTDGRHPRASSSEPQFRIHLW